MSQMLRVIQEARPVDEEWKCHRSGDCCRSVPQVTISKGEYDYLQHNLTLGQLFKLKFFEVDENFMAWKAGPCPMLEDDKCTIHPHRPYVCRRFGCLRVDPSTEPYQDAPLSPYLKYGTIGCSNLRDRLISSRVARRLYEKIQRKAQRWGRKHGWREE